MKCIDTERKKAMEFFQRVNDLIDESVEHPADVPPEHMEVFRLGLLTALDVYAKTYRLPVRLVAHSH